nr:solute carrier family 25 member 44 isoform X1 [Anolis sagrei ordinatus]
MENDKRNIQIIEWEHLDKRKFYLLGVCMTMMIRVSVYPFTLIRTRLQVQKGKSLYQGTFDAFGKILRAEGPAGLYRGFLVNTLTLVSGQCYVTTYELTRGYVSRYSSSNTLKSLLAGGSASLVAQSITVPIDVVSQHLMMQQRQGQSMGRFRVTTTEQAPPPGRPRPPPPRLFWGQTRDIVAQIFRADGVRGFYRGYVASLLTYIPNSAVWWPFYHFYAAGQPDPEGLSAPAAAGHLGPAGRRHRLHPHQPHGRHPGQSPGGGQELHPPDLPPADGRGGPLGADQGPLGPHHLGHAFHHRHRGRVRDPQEAQPAARAGRLPALVAHTGKHWAALGSGRTTIRDAREKDGHKRQRRRRRL